MRVTTFTLHRLRLPLTEPYHLALGTVDAFDTVLVIAEGEDGGLGFGEATVLTGYTPETIEGSCVTAASLARRAAGMATADAKDLVLIAQDTAPFAATAVMTAIEMLEGHPLLDVRERTAVPLLAILNAAEDGPLAAEIEARLGDGYRTLKVKVGFDADRDLRRVRFIQSALAGRAEIRIDGNQGYALDEAVRFAAALQPDGIELFEQPCAAGDWDGACAVAEASPVPMMLDESIYGPADVDRAAELGAARFIKLKLMKAGGLQSLAAGLERIRDRGMTPVLGNGVAGDVGCWMEACVARTLIDNAGEMNGFLKPRSGIFETPLTVEAGAVVLDAETPRLEDGAALSALAAETARFPGD